MNEKCKEAIQKVEKILAKSCGSKVNTLKPCDEKESDCPCSSSNESIEGGLVDLVVIIDSSTTMPGKARAVNKAAPIALENAKKKCGVEVRATWLFVDGAKPGSSPSHGLGPSAGIFSQSHQQYLESIGEIGPFYHDNLDTGYAREQGADAVADISQFFDWRENACRSILYISDTKLEGYQTNAAASDSAVTQAINVANLNNVTVFAHRADNVTFAPPMTVAEIDEDYVNLCVNTGGYALTGGIPSVDLYKDIIEKAVCNCNKGKGCTEVNTPEIKPCVSISWGDSDCDSLETDDFEILCISVCNCYSNITFNNFAISMIEITDSDGNAPANLPDGTLSVQAVPIGPICFGNIPPCIDGEASCVSREFVINTRGAKDGKYQIRLHGICFDVNVEYHQESCFNFKLCKS